MENKKEPKNDYPSYISNMKQYKGFFYYIQVELYAEIGSLGGNPIHRITLHSLECKINNMYKSCVPKQAFNMVSHTSTQNLKEDVIGLEKSYFKNIDIWLGESIEHKILADELGFVRERQELPIKSKPITTPFFQI